jgi:hypothetical protein
MLESVCYGVYCAVAAPWAAVTVAGLLTAPILRTIQALSNGLAGLPDDKYLASVVQVDCVADVGADCPTLIPIDIGQRVRAA